MPTDQAPLPLLLDPAPLKPLLKWPGGKRWLLPHLSPIWDRFRERRLVEPMAGGLAVTLGLGPRRALVNDINVHVINLYQQVRDGLAFHRAWENDEAFYYAARAEFNALIRAGRSNTPQAAELLFYLNRTGYNGLCRFNNTGEYNVPFGRYKTVNYGRDLQEHRAAFQAWSFTSGDFEAIELTASDFVYADPPYDVEFTKYAKQDFTWVDQIRLAEWLARHAGPVVLSNQATPRVVELYGRLRFDMRFLDGPRRISCTGDRAPAREVLATRGL